MTQKLKEMGMSVVRSHKKVLTKKEDAKETKNDSRVKRPQAKGKARNGSSKGNR